MNLNKRQIEIVDIVKENAPITGDNIAKLLNISRATIRPDLTLLTMLGVLGARPKVGYFYSGNSKQKLITEKLDKILVKDRMSLPVVLEEDISIYDAIVELFLQNISSIIVTNKGNLAGMVSRKDLLRTAIGKVDLKNIPVGVIMTRMPNVAYIDENSTVVKAAKIIQDREVDTIPVIKEVNGNLKVVGRFTKTNSNNLLVDLSIGDY